MQTLPASTPRHPRTSAKAVWSLILGILALLLTFACIGPLFAIPAVILGHMAHTRIQRTPNELNGSGLALGGLITGYISIALAIFIIPLLAAIAIPNFVKARETAQRNACLNHLNQIDGAKTQWALDNQKPTGAVPSPADVDPYLPGGFNALHCPGGGTYSINAVGELPTCSIPSHQLQFPPSANGPP